MGQTPGNRLHGEQDCGARWMKSKSQHQHNQFRMPESTLSARVLFAIVASLGSISVGGCAGQRPFSKSPSADHASAQQVPVAPGQVRVQTVTPREGTPAPNYAQVPQNAAPLAAPPQNFAGSAPQSQPASTAAMAAMSQGAPGSAQQTNVQPVSRSSAGETPLQAARSAAPLGNTGPGQASQDSKTNVAQARQVVDRALAFYLQTPAYTCKMTRQESVGGKQQQPEILLMKFRLQPRSVFYQWADDKNAGRECVYVEGQNKGQMITRGGKADLFFVGRTMRIDPNGMLAKAKSRYSIAESGMDNMVRRLETRVQNYERGDLSTGRVVYLGQVTREESAVPLDYVRNDVPPGADPAFPKGGIRHWYFDPRDGRLVVMNATGPSGEFMEYYRIDQFTPANLTDRDFDPEAIWPSKASASGPSWGMSDPLAAADNFLPK